MSDSVKIRQLRKYENVFVFVLVWFCILSIHTSYRRSMSIGQNELGKPTSHGDDTMHLRETILGAKIQPDKFKALKDTQLDKQADNGTRIQKDGQNQQNKRSDQSKGKQNDDDPLKWFRERPKRQKPSGVPKKNPHLKNYLINPEKHTCGDGQVDFLIYFHSRTGNFDNREKLRQTWAALDIFKNITVRRIFLLGKAENSKQMENIESESKRYNDIVQGEFVDSFRNISLKVLMMLDWVHNYCPQAQYILKSDDDFFVNPFLVVEKFVSQISKKNRAIMCHLKEDALVIKEKDSRWYIPTDLLINDVLLPRHCSGYVTIFTGELIPEMYIAAGEQPYVEVDDVYLFGFLAGDVAFVEYIDIQEQLTLNQDVGLQEYKNNHHNKHVGVNAWGKGTQNILWTETLKHLSPMGKKLVNPKYLKS